MLHKWRERRVRYESPIEMARVREKLQLVAMKAVAIVGEQMEERNRGRNCSENTCVGPARAAAGLVVEVDCGRID